MIMIGIAMSFFCSLAFVHSFATYNAYKVCGNRYDNFIEDLLYDPAIETVINENEAVKELALQLHVFRVTGSLYNGYNHLMMREVLSAVFGVFGLGLFLLGSHKIKKANKAMESTK